MIPGRIRGRGIVPPNRNGPMFGMYPPGPPAPDACWAGPSRGGFRGRPNPNFIDGPFPGPRRMMPSDQLPMDPYDFGPHPRAINPMMMAPDNDFRSDMHHLSIHNRCFPGPDIECGRFDVPMKRGFGPVDEPGSVDADYFPPVGCHGPPPDFAAPGPVPPPDFAGPTPLPPRDFTGPRPVLPPDFAGPVPVPPPDFSGPGSIAPPEWAGMPDVPPIRGPRPPPVIPNETGPPDPQISKFPPPTKARSTLITPSVKPPPGRSTGVISYVDNDYGFIEREDQRKFYFCFDAFLGNRVNLIPGVTVHFTAFKEMGSECATDVIVAPGGTDEVDATKWEGIVTKTLPDTLLSGKDVYPGRINGVVSNKPIVLAFGVRDCQATLLNHDRVHFNLVTDLITKVKRATNITPRLAETLPFTKETREMGVIINAKDDTYSIMNEKHDDLSSASGENVSNEELAIFDEVEFTVLRVKEMLKATRIKKLPEGSVVFDPLTLAKFTEAMEKANVVITNKNKCKPVVTEEISTETYEGTVIRIAPEKQQEGQLAKGMLSATVEGVEKKMSFTTTDVVTKATMVEGDKVQFNLCVHLKTKEERAVNVSIIADNFHESTEQRRIGVVIGLTDGHGFIKTQHDPKLFFKLSEVMEDTKLTMSEKVEFTIVPNETGNQAIRIKRLIESVFTSAPKLEGLGKEKEKKKMTIKLLRDPKEQMRDLSVKLEDKSNEPLDTANLKDDDSQPVGVSDKVTDVKSDTGSKDQDKGAKWRVNSALKERSSSQDRSQQRSSRSPGRNSHSRETSIRNYRRRKSPSAERGEGPDRQRKSHNSSGERPSRSRHSRSKSRDRPYRAQHSRSRSRDRSSRPNRRRSRSPEPREDYHRRRSHSRERSGRRRSKSPDERSRVRRPANSRASESTRVKMDDAQDAVDEKLARKKKELEMLNTLIAQKREAIVIDHNHGNIKVEPDTENKYKPATYLPDRKPDPPPIKSILKKRSGPPPQSDVTASFPKTSGDHLSCNQTLFPVSQPSETTGISPVNRTSIQQSFSSYTSMPDHFTATQETLEFRRDPSTIFNRPNVHQPVLTYTDVPSMFSNYSVQQPPPSNMATSYSLDKQDTKPSTDLQSALYSHFSQSSLHHTASTSDPASNHPSSPGQTSAPQEESNLYKQMQRFVNMLNKGVDPNVLESLVQEARKGGTSSAEQKNTQQLSNRNEYSKDELYDPFKEADDPVDDGLLPHERAVQDGSGFSRIVGMKHGEHFHDDMFRHPRTEDQEHFLYGRQKDANNPVNFAEEPNKYAIEKDWLSEDRDYHGRDRNWQVKEHGHSWNKPDQYTEDQEREQYVEHKARYASLHEKYAKHTGRYVEDRKGYEKVTLADTHRPDQKHSPVHQKKEETSEKKDEKMEQFAKIQSLLQTIGFNLDTAEVSKLADRTRERLYGKKVKLTNPSTVSLDKEGERRGYRYGQHRSQTNVSDSEGFRSASPITSSNRKVYMSYPDYLKHEDSHDETEVVMDRDLHSLTRTIRNSPPSTEDAQASTRHATESRYSTTEAPQATSGTMNTTSQYPVYDNTRYSELGSNQAANFQQSPYAAVPTSPSVQYPPGLQTLPTPVSSGPPNPYGAPLSVPPPIPGPPPSLSYFAYPPPASSTQPAPSTSGNLISIPLQSVAPASQQPRTFPSSRYLTLIKTVTSQKAQSVEPAKFNTVEGESRAVTPITEDEIKAKQKKRLEQFNQRMREKKEQQMEAQRTRGPKQKSAPDKDTSKEIPVKNVWICGHSLVFWAEKKIKSPEVGMQLGMDPNSVRIWWKGMQGMTWHQLLPQLLQLKGTWPRPDAILMHLGGNDLGKSSPEVFLSSVRKDLASMRSIFPECLLVWSNILPRRSWRHTEDSQAVDNIRMAINRSVHSIIAEFGGTALTHDNIRLGSDAGLYRPDGVHLSGKGIDIFNLNLQDFLEKWETETQKNGPQSEQGAMSS